MACELLLEPAEGIYLLAIPGTGRQDLSGCGADKAVPAELLSGGRLEEERVLVLVCFCCGGADLEVGGGGRDEVGGDLTVDGDEGRFLIGIGVQ